MKSGRGSMCIPLCLNPGSTELSFETGPGQSLVTNATVSGIGKARAACVPMTASSWKATAWAVQPEKYGGYLPSSELALSLEIHQEQGFSQWSPA